MMGLLSIFCVIMLFLYPIDAEDNNVRVTTKDFSDNSAVMENTEENNEFTDQPEIALRGAMEEYEVLYKESEKHFKHEEGVVLDSVEVEYQQMLDILRDMDELVRIKNTSYSFVDLQGFDRILVPSLSIYHEKLTENLLILIKSLFELAPKATAAALPMNAVDRFLDIFANDGNLALKAHALDILYVWLPWNPRLQMRVMKLKGLEPFYEQIPKLDGSVIYTLLDLFNKIIDEHLTVFNYKKEKIKASPEKFKTYQKIGLLERLSTKPMCQGLLSLFLRCLQYNTENNNLILPVYLLMKNVVPFCEDKLEKTTEAVEILDDVLKNIRDPNTVNIFKNHNLNLADVEYILTKYRDSVNPFYIKDEL